MDTKTFWQLIKSTRGDEQQPTRLEEALLQYPLQEIEDFDKIFSNLYASHYRANGQLWTALTEVVGFVSDDSFIYFMCWLIGQGEEVYNEVTRCPARIGEFVIKDHEWHREEMLYVAMNVIEKVTGKIPE